MESVGVKTVVRHFALTDNYVSFSCKGNDYILINIEFHVVIRIPNANGINVTVEVCNQLHRLG
jgi:hypothetical protein